MANEQTIAITDFSPGLQTQADPRELKPGAAQACENVTIDRGDLRVRPGRAVTTLTPAGTTDNVRALAELFIADRGVTPDKPAHRFFSVIGSRIYWNVNHQSARPWSANTAIAQGQFRRPTTANDYVYEATAGGTTADDEPDAGNVPPNAWPTVAGASITDGTVTWTCRSVASHDYWDEIDPTCTVADNAISMAEMDGLLYLVDGSNWVLQLDADGQITRLVDFPAPTTAPVIVPKTTELILDNCDNSTAAVSFADYQKQGGAKIPFWRWLEHTDSIWHAWSSVSGYPGTEDVDQIYAYAQDAVVYDDDTVARTHSMSLFISAENDYTPHLNCGDVYLMRQLDAPLAFLPTGVVSGFDLSTATRINFSMCVEAGEMLGTVGGGCNLYLVLGENATVSGWQKVPITADINGTELAALPFGADIWNEFSIDITGLDDAAINGVTWAGFLFENLDIKPDATPQWQDNDFVRITFSPLRANMSTASFVQDTYEFTYTFYHETDGEESTEYIDPSNLATPYPSLDINYNVPRALEVKVTRPIIGAGNPVPDGAYIYARGGVNKGEMRRIASVPFDGDATAVRTAISPPWQGVYNQNEPLLGQYIGRPPKGMTLLAPYRNRMLYIGHIPRMQWTASTGKKIGDDVIAVSAGHDNLVFVVTAISSSGMTGTTGASEPAWNTALGGTTVDNEVTWTTCARDAADTLYYSNYGDPTRVPQVPFSLAQSPTLYGGWADTERHGEDATGLIGAGPCAFIFKRQAIFRAQGDPGVTGDGQDAFFIQQLQTTDGCLSPQSVCRVEHRVVWQGVDKILSIAAGEDAPTCLTDVITPTVAAYTPDLQRDAWAVYDPAERRLFMFYPIGSDSVLPDSECLVLSLRTGGWVQWTAQPGACGLYSPFAPTPGLYLADGYGQNGQGKLFRVSTDPTDAASDGSTASIAWVWVSGELRPFPGAYLQVAGLRANLITPDAGGSRTLAATLWLNNSDDRTLPDGLNAPKVLTVTRLTSLGSTPQGNGVVDWTPVPHGECESIAVCLARNDSDLAAVRDIALTVRPRSAVRGRTVARA